MSNNNIISLNKPNEIIIERKKAISFTNVSSRDIIFFEILSKSLLRKVNKRVTEMIINPINTTIKTIPAAIAACNNIMIQTFMYLVSEDKGTQYKAAKYLAA